MKLPIVTATSVLALALLLAGCGAGPTTGTGDSPADPPGESVDPNGKQGEGVVCDFLSGDAIASVVTEETTDAWNETALSETACEWANESVGLVLTIEVLTGRDSVLAGIEEATGTAMIGPHETTVVRSESDPDAIESAYIVAGFDYFVKVSQSPGMLTDEQFSELAYPAAIEFENSPLNVG